MAKTTGINPQDNQPVCPDCKTFDVFHWVASINRKNGPRRPPSYETFLAASQGELDISSVVGQALSLVRLHNTSSGLVAESTKCSQRCKSPPPRTQCSSVYRRLKRRLGHSLKSRFYQRTVVRSRKIIAHKRFRTKGSVLGPKTLQASMPKSNSPGCHGQLNRSSLHQQTGRDSVSRDVRPSMEDHELVSSIQNISTCQTYSRVPKCDRGLPVQINSNSVNGVVSVPSGLQKNLHKVVHTSGGSVCHSAKPQVATICLSSSRSKHMEHRCSKHKLVKPCSLCLPSNRSTSKSNTKGPPVQLPPNPDSPGLAGHALVLVPLQLPASPNLFKQSSNQVFHNNPQYLNLHAWCLGVSNSKNKVSLLKWQRELLPLKGHQQDLFTKQSGPFLKKGAEKIQWMSPNLL